MTNVNELLLKAQQSIEQFLKRPSSSIDKDIALSHVRLLYEAIIHQPTTGNSFDMMNENSISINHTEELKTETVSLVKNESPSFYNSESVAAEKVSLNEMLVKDRKEELVDKLEHLPIKDLKLAIGFNDKFSFIQNLFAADNDAYKNAIESLNNCATLADANKIISNLKSQYNWAKNIEVADTFIDLVNRRF